MAWSGNMSRAILTNFCAAKQLRPLQFVFERLCSTGGSEEIKDVPRKEKINKAMRAYLERARAHDEFMKQEKHEFEVGKRHLANIMGADPEHFTQEDIDKSIEYLFPSALFDKQARPIMRPPDEIFPATKAAEFDETGRPHHPLFYTTKPYLSQLLHDCAHKLVELDSFEDKMIRKQMKPDPSAKFVTLGSVWISKEKLERVVLEKLVDIEYKNFVDVMERIANHSYGYRLADFIQKFRVPLMAKKAGQTIIEPEDTPDGRRSVTISDCMRKSTRGSLTLTYPGTGKFSINGHGIDFFSDDQCRNQVRKFISFKNRLFSLSNEYFSQDS